MRRRSEEAARRVAERREREDNAPRLIAAIPNLESLCLEVQERSPGAVNAEASHIRRIVVPHAPALFAFPCHDSQCKGGGHDATASVMRGLLAREAHFEGESACSGTVGEGLCHRVLRFVATATYRP